MGMTNTLPVNDCRGSGISERIFVSREGAKAQSISVTAPRLRVFAPSRDKIQDEARWRGNASGS